MPKALDSAHISSATRDWGAYIVALLPYCVLPFSPLASFVAGILVLLIFAKALGDTPRILLGLCVAISGSLIYGSQLVLPESIGGDFYNYYMTYKKLYNHNFSALFDYGVVEIGLPLVFVVFQLLFGMLEPSSLRFLIAFFNVVLLWIWLEKYPFKDLQTFEKSIALALVFVFFDYSYSMLNMRQFPSAIFVLFALSASRLSTKILFLFVASAFHMTAIVFFVLMMLLSKFPRFTLITLIVLLCGFITFFEHIITIYRDSFLLKAPLFHKFYHYVLNQVNYIFNGEIIVLFFMSVVLVMFCIGIRDDVLKRKYFSWVLGFYIIYICSAFLDHILPYRLTLIYYMVAFGFFLFVAFRRFLFFGYGFFGLLCIYKLKTILFPPNLNHMTTLWIEYPPFGQWFYYILR